MGELAMLGNIRITNLVKRVISGHLGRSGKKTPADLIWQKIMLDTPLTEYGFMPEEDVAPIFERLRTHSSLKNVPDPPLGSIKTARDIAKMFHLF